jgi:hypothetical protein
MMPQEAALCYHRLGANVTAIETGTKGPAHTWTRWHTHRQERVDVLALPWRGYTTRKDTKRHKAGEQVTVSGVGVINGINGWRTFDIDAPKDKERNPLYNVSEAVVDRLLAGLGLPATYAWVWRSGSGSGWEVAIRCPEAMPEGALTPDKRETGVYTGWPEEGGDFHHLELRWQECQTVYPPCSDGRGYQWRHEPPQEAPTTVPLYRVISAFYDLCPPPPHNLGTIDRSMLEAIKNRFDLVAYAIKEIGGEAVDEGTEVRILGNQGLLIDPERRIWYVHGERIGGDALDLVAFARYRTTARNLNGKSAEILQAAAEWAGVSIPERLPSVRVDVTTGEIIDSRDAPPAKVVNSTGNAMVEWWQKGTTAAQLYHTEFVPLHWTVENILPEGAAVIAGKPKSRKSWVALGVAVACTMGEKVFGRLLTRPGRVLYLDLESNQRRMRGRLFSMVGHQMQRMENLHVFTDWPRGQEGIDALNGWMQTFPDTVLIVIDVLADFRRPRDPKEDPYTYDRETVKPINEWAERHRVTVLLIHHTRKMKADDVFDEISGSTGLPSAVATMWVLGRAPNGENEMVLAMRGRDLINDEPLALEWDDYQNRFISVGSAADSNQSAERRALLKVMADDGDWTPKALGAEMSRPVNNIKQLLRALLAEGLIEKTGHGKYARVPERDHDAHSDHDDHDDHFDNFRSGGESDRDHFQGQKSSPGLAHGDASKPESYQSDRDLRHSEDHDDSTF